jgi:DNA-binding response OmpR family regulator
MRNKILVVGANAKEQEELEQILEAVMEEGGELIFAKKEEEGLKLLKKEAPPLVFLDESCNSKKENWEQAGVHVVVLCHKQEERKGDYLVKPLKRSQVLEKCRAFLNPEPATRIPPM